MSQRTSAAADVTADVFARTVPILVERHGWGGTRKASMANMEIRKDSEEQSEVDKTYLSLRKRLLNAPEMRAISQHDTKFREFLYANALPWRPGLYLVPVANINAVYDAAKAWEGERERLADEAMRAYPGHVASMREKLGSLYNPGDYPSAQRFRQAFWVSWRFVNFGVPKVLETLRKEVFAEEAAKLRQEGVEARQMIEQHLRSSLLGITQHLTELLRPKGDGKMPQLKDAALEKLVGFLDTLEARNVTNDAELGRLAARLRALGSGLNAELLRDDKDLRARTAAQMAEVTAALEGLVEDAPDRAIRFRDEEGAA